MKMAAVQPAKLARNFNVKRLRALKIGYNTASQASVSGAYLNHFCKISHKWLESWAKNRAEGAIYWNGEFVEQCGEAARCDYTR